MHKQRGVSLINMLLWAIVLGFGALLTVKLIPTFSEYFGVKSVLKALVQEQAGAPVSEIRDSFDKRATIEYITSVKSSDLDIVQDQSGITISVQYQRTIPLIANASLVFDFSVEEHRNGSAQ
ncbi:DUF4845 domain-containing protein [Chitinimonas koreensis]|uniref:DUF4845 domain-containing protein n=1 Tax=Chitinimonas koreensis TaxID=356302 RepID=UPI0004291110|nr:DUF4845 domain-containing protein [Chitinimonas koreensis]QNM95577.1 DUF4845 domain-containing protein [Chitinimonas koreensis]